MSDIAEKVLKINPSMFEDGKIQMLVRSENGYRKFYIWMKLLCWLRANNSKEGKFKIGRKNLLIDDIARAIYESYPFVEETLGELLEIELMKVKIGECYYIPNWDKWQNAQKEDRAEKEKRFVPPTLEEVKPYCEKHGVDAEAFVAYYEQSNWSLGKGKKVVDWKACVRTWESNAREREKIKQENREYWKKQRQKERQKGNLDRFAKLDEAILRAGG